MMEERSNSGASGSEPMAGGGEAAGQSVDAGEMGETGETLKRKNNLVKSFGFCGCLHGDGLRSRCAWACNSPWKP